MVLEGRDIHCHAGHDRRATEHPDQCPNGNQDIAHGRRRLFPISHEVGDRARQPAPWRCWYERVEVTINVKMPAMILEDRVRVVSMSRMLRLATLFPHGEVSRWSPANGSLMHHNGLDNGSAKPTVAAAAETGFYIEQGRFYTAEANGITKSDNSGAQKKRNNAPITRVELRHRQIREGKQPCN